MSGSSKSEVPSSKEEPEGILVADGEAIYDLVAATARHAVQAEEATYQQVRELGDPELRALLAELREGELDAVAQEILWIGVVEAARRWTEQEEDGER